jgi:hypothetical protein
LAGKVEVAYSHGSAIARTSDGAEDDMIAALATALALAVPATTQPPEASPPIPAESSPGTGTAPVTPPTSFGLGAQTELIAPDVGISALLASLDAGWFRVDGSAGIGVFERGANAIQRTNIYGFGLRAFFPVHRSRRADFSLGAGGALTFLNSDAGSSTAWIVLVGAEARIFVVENAAILGALGAGALFRDQGNALIIGARPIGSAGFVYYFR